MPPTIGTCSSCRGTGEVTALLCPVGKVMQQPCRDCRGTGSIDDARAAELTEGLRRRADRLEVEGLIKVDRGNITVTSKGFSVANVISQEQAIENAKQGLEPRQRRIFDIVASVYPESITREEIARSMTSDKKPEGIHPRGGSLGEDLGRLRGRGLIEYGRGEARARDFLFAGAIA